jgi:hypothetical protein
MWFKKKTINVQEKPFAFEPEVIDYLDEKFNEAGISCVLVPNMTSTKGFHPVEERKEKG